MAGILCSLTLMSVALAGSSANYNLDWNVTGGGGGDMSSSSYTMVSTVSQNTIGFSSSSSYKLGGGYWYGATTVPVEQADLIITEKWVAWPDNCTIFYNVTNIGSVTAPSGHNTTLYVDGVKVADDSVPVSLASGESYIGSFSSYTWAFTPRDDNITVCADNDDTVAESNETNNCLESIWMCGDVNENQMVNVLDVLEVYSRALDPGYPLDLEWAADVNDDGTINVLDVLGVYSRALDPGYDLNCSCEV